MMSFDERIVEREFYQRNVVRVAQEMLGKLLVRRIERRKMVGRIVEAEAYRGSDDPASHAYRGVNKRNRVMFENGGYAYVYFIYGMHCCINVTAEPKGIPAAVLIRALEPLEGIELMTRFRRSQIEDLTNGPARLTQAFNITLKHNGVDLTKKGELFVSWGSDTKDVEIVATERIGVRRGSEMKWRFFLANSPYVSRKRDFTAT